MTDFNLFAWLLVLSIASWNVDCALLYCCSVSGYVGETVASCVTQALRGAPGQQRKQRKAPHGDLRLDLSYGYVVT